MHVVRIGIESRTYIATLNLLLNILHACMQLHITILLDLVMTAT